ncbi:MAG: hypothetical protein ACJ790_14345 [Myxococcaceae bacterium]
MKRLAVLFFLLASACATTSKSSSSCPPKPSCLTAPQCYVDSNACEICQCSAASDEWRQKPVGPPPSLNP